jgi:acyl transferase domain-containing protein
MADVAIVGIGAVFPRAGDAPTFWHNIRSGIDAITEVPADRWDPGLYYRPNQTGDDTFYCHRGGFIDDLAYFSPAEFGIMPAAVHGIEPDQLLVLRAAAEAIADAGPLPKRERVGVIIGRGGFLTPGVARLDQRVQAAHQITGVLRDLIPELSQQQLDAVRAEVQQRLAPDPAESSIALGPNFAASRIANRFDLRGPAYTLDAACASSLLAVDHAVRELTEGRCDAVLAGGVHVCHHPTLWSAFTQLRALSAGEQIRPFDAHADGTLLSEGAGVVVLKRLADAAEAGDHIYAVIRGVGVASDGRATSMMNPLSEGEELAIRRAWAAAGLDPAAPGALGLVEAHGTATPVGDQIELETLERVFGPGGGEAIAIGTVKSMIGHAMPAAGMAGLIKAAFAVYHGVLPPTLHITEPHPVLARSRFDPVVQARPWDTGTVRRAGVNAFGFGGINAHVIVEAPPAQAARTGAARLRPRDGAAGEFILRLATDTPREMAQRLDVPDGELMAAPGGEPGQGPCRLAIVAPDQRSLALARKVVARGTPWRGRSDVWFSPRPLLAGPEQVAFLFPGFEADWPPRVDGIAEAFGLPALQLHGPGAGQGASNGVVEHALEIVAVSRLLASALGVIGITPGAVAGHSLGEWTAMVVAGVVPGADEFIAAMQPSMAEIPDAVYAALGAGADRVQELLGDSGEAAITHDNCPHQCVVCGPEAVIGDVMQRARSAGILAQTLPFRTGFHSRRASPYLAKTHTALRQLRLCPAVVPLWSATSVEPFPPDQDRMQDLVLRHLVEPVRFRQLTLALHESGVRAFVQVGSGSLTRFVGDTLAGRDHLTVSTAAPQREALSQLRRAASGLWADGLNPSFGRLTRKAPGGVRLRLGGSLIRLPGTLLGPAAQTQAPPEQALLGTGPPAAQAALAEFSALVAETNASARTLAQALVGQPHSPHGPHGPHGDAPRAAPRDVTRDAPRDAPAEAPRDEPTELSMNREFSLSTMPELADHCLVPQAVGWPTDSDRFPVVPMAVMLYIMADAALALVPRRVVVGFEQVTATRWLPASPPTTAQVHAVRAGEERVRVRIDGYCSGFVILASAFPAPPAPATESLRRQRPAPVTAARFYQDRWMFHGPRFAGVTEITSIADDGITGTIRSLPARGTLIDSAAQLIAHWLMVSRTINQNALPKGVRAIRLYGPPPPAGESVRVVAWIRDVTDTDQRGDAELRTADGRVWCRIESLTNHRFSCDLHLAQVVFHPERVTLSQAHPDGWNVLWERWSDTASRELTMRGQLSASEREQYQTLNPLQQRQWLLARIAAKDAARHWLWQRGAGPIYPAEITVAEVDGELRVRGPFRAPRVSVAQTAVRGHSRGCAVAIAGEEPIDFTIGIDDDGQVRIEQPGRETRVIGPANGTATGTASQAAKGQG